MDRSDFARRPDRIFRTLTIVYAAIAAFAATGCAVDGEPRSATTASPLGKTPSEAVRQNDDSGKRLPFTTTFPDRWSRNNDGTKYEPCTALTDAELADTGLDPHSVSDIALANRQTVRGCLWQYASLRNSSLSQGTGNAPTFEERITDRDWYKTSWDIRIDGRLVMVDSTGRYDCSTTVKSGDAPVVTIVMRTADLIPLTELCKYAIDFTRRTIPKMEPPAP